MNKTLSSQYAKQGRKKRTPMVDVRSKKASFKIHHVQDDVPTVEPLFDESDAEETFKDEETLHEDHESSFYEDSKMSEKPEPPVYVRAEDMAPKEQVKVKFANFVQLVTTQDVAAVIQANPQEEIIMNSNLLTELASAHDKKGEKKIPVVFIVGMAIGVFLAYILFSTK